MIQSAKIPLTVITSENQDAQGLEHLHFTIYFLSTLPIKDFNNILNTVGNGEYHAWIFLINTTIAMDCFDKVMQSLLANSRMKLTIIEESLQDDDAVNMMTQLKTLQAIRYFENKDNKSIQYLFLSKRNCLANNIDQTVGVEILRFCEIKGCDSSYLLFSVSFLFSNYRQLESIDISNCNIGDHGCTMLLNYFTQQEYSSTLNFLNLSNNNLSWQSFNDIAKLIIVSKLKTLFVSHNDVKEDDIADAVCKLQSESNEDTVPVIHILF